jgi:hypothetical protein
VLHWTVKGTCMDDGDKHVQVKLLQTASASRPRGLTMLSALGAVPAHQRQQALDLALRGRPAA